MVATREAKWLLNESIAEYLDKQLYQKAIDLQTIEAVLKDVPVDEERTKNVRAQAEIKKCRGHTSGTLQSAGSSSEKPRCKVSLVFDTNHPIDYVALDNNLSSCGCKHVLSLCR